MWDLQWTKSGTATGFFPTGTFDILRNCVTFHRYSMTIHPSPTKYNLYFYSTTNEMHQFLKCILFCSSTPHVSAGLSVHQQESKTVHTASGIHDTGSANCFLAGTRWNISFPLANCFLAGTRWNISFPLASSQQNLFDIYLMLYVQP